MDVDPQNDKLSSQILREGGIELTMPPTSLVTVSTSIGRGTLSEVIHPRTLLGNPELCHISVMVTSTGTMELDSKSKLKWPPDVHWIRGIRISNNSSETNVVLCLRDRRGAGTESCKKDLVLEVLQPIAQWQELVMWFSNDILLQVLPAWTPMLEETLWEKIAIVLTLLETVKQGVFSRLQWPDLLPDEEIVIRIREGDPSNVVQKKLFTDVITNNQFCIPVPNRENSILITAEKRESEMLPPTEELPIPLFPTEEPQISLSPTEEPQIPFPPTEQPPIPFPPTEQPPIPLPPTEQLPIPFPPTEQLPIPLPPTEQPPMSLPTAQYTNYTRPSTATIQRLLDNKENNPSNAKLIHKHFVGGKVSNPSYYRSKKDATTLKPLHKCTVCGHDFISAYRLKKHINEMHPDTIPKKCNYCRKVFIDSQRFNNHMQLMHRYRHPCSLCGKPLSSENDYAEHLRSAHPEYLSNRSSLPANATNLVYNVREMPISSKIINRNQKIPSTQPIRRALPANATNPTYNIREMPLTSKANRNEHIPYSRPINPAKNIRLPANETISIPASNKNSQLVFDHVIAGSFETARDLLQEQIGAVNFNSYKKLFVFLQKSWREVISSKQPQELVDVPNLCRRLNNCYQLTTVGNYSNAIFKFREIIYLITLLNGKSEQMPQVQNMLRICSTYICGLQMETLRKSVPLSSPEQQKRHCEMAAYFTHCNLRSVHQIITLRSALNLFIKFKNYKTASSFAKRLLSLKPPTEIARQARDILEACGDNPEDNMPLLYDERRPFALCGYTYTPIYDECTKEICPLCSCAYSSEYKGKICKACGVSEIGRECLGLRISRD